MDKCKARARRVLYWPGMASDIVTIFSKIVKAMIADIYYVQPSIMIYFLCSVQLCFFLKKRGVVNVANYYNA